MSALGSAAPLTGLVALAPWPPSPCPSQSQPPLGPVTGRRCPPGDGGQAMSLQHSQLQPPSSTRNRQVRDNIPPCGEPRFDKRQYFPPPTNNMTSECRIMRQTRGVIGQCPISCCFFPYFYSSKFFIDLGSYCTISQDLISLFQQQNCHLSKSPIAYINLH